MAIPLRQYCQLMALIHLQTMNQSNLVSLSKIIPTKHYNGLRIFTAVSRDLDDIDVPNLSEDQGPYSLYVNAIQSLPAQLDAVFSRTCIVCGGGSRNFDNCNMLNDLVLSDAS